METGLKGLVLGAGIVLTCLVIGIGFYIGRESRGLGFQAAEQIREINRDLTGGKLEQYDNSEITGGEVIYAIRKYQKEVPITVYTAAGVFTYQGNFKLSDNLEEKAGYISPSKLFYGQLSRNKNETITGIIFRQK